MEEVVPEARWRSARLSPFVRLEGGSAHNPLAAFSIEAGSQEIVFLRALAEGEADVSTLSEQAWDRLVREAWIVLPGDDVSTRHRLKIVSLETNSVCNQACYFCPVSVDPREDAVMPDAMFTSILEQLRSFRGTLDAIFLQSYNEPTVDRRFVRHVKEIMAAGLPVAVLTNCSGLTPARVDEILEAGPLRYLSVNFSTMDAARYAADRGRDQADLVLRHLDYMKSLRVADEMKILVLGRGDETHRMDFDEISSRFAGSNFLVESHDVMDRAGYFEFGLKPEEPIRNLRGCENIGSRPIEHLHITPRGLCVLCCEDYDETYVVGDLARETILEVLEGPEMARMRRWVYGIEEAPADFICRRCVFARSGD